MAASTPSSGSLLDSVMRFLPISKKNARKILASLVGTLLCLVAWQAVCSIPGAPLPGPVEVFTDTQELIIGAFDRTDPNSTDVGIFWHLMASLQRVAIGFSVAAIVGVLFGIVIGSNQLVYDAFDPVFQLLRTIPPLAWLPISLAALKNNQSAALFVIFITAVWPVLLNTVTGVQQVPQDYKNVARVLRLGRVEYFLNVLFPATVPYVFTGLRIGVGLSWLAIVAAEMLVGGVGIGFFIWDAYNSSLTSEIILALIFVGLVGLLLDRLVAFVGSISVPPERR
ncbi:MAG: nitrate ABC transporter, permease protein [Oscillatoriales cyanobacterium]|nr:MAG: nitrate ABC transporter, permease protein [Oscillatoriales cyanobacterium]